MSLSELCDALRKVRARSEQVISTEDVKRAIKKLSVLGGGYRVVILGGQPFVLSVPTELSTDNTWVLQHCASTGEAFTTVPRICAALRWSIGRATSALQVSSDGAVTELFTCVSSLYNVPHPSHAHATGSTFRRIYMAGPPGLARCGGWGRSLLLFVPLEHGLAWSRTDRGQFFIGQ